MSDEKPWPNKKNGKSQMINRHILAQLEAQATAQICGFVVATIAAELFPRQKEEWKEIATKTLMRPLPTIGVYAPQETKFKKIKKPCLG